MKRLYIFATKILGYGRPFKWSDYLSRSRAIAAPKELFSPVSIKYTACTELDHYD